MDKKKWVKHIPLFILEAVVLMAAVGFLYITLRATDSETGAEKDIIREENIAVNPEVKEKIVETKENGEENKYTGIYNVAFFGVDARDGSLGKGNRSDTIMICSIDMDKHEIRLVSIYRDTYLNLGNDIYKKCNTAYALGGPEQAISMINMNTDLYLTDYITVGFEGLMKAVDALGGIEMEVTETEISHLNNYQSTMAQEMDIEYTPVAQAGRQTLNGLQATAYCRIRYGGGDDFKRTERQREVLLAIADKAKTASPATLNEIANAIFDKDEIYTSLDVSEILELLGGIAKYQVVAQGGFPEETRRTTGTIGEKGSCVVPLSLSDNVQWLHEFLFEDEEYSPSETVLQISDKVKSDTSGYVK